VVAADFVPAAEEITVDYPQGTVTNVTLHDGSVVRLHKVGTDYDPTDRAAAWAYLSAKQQAGEIPMGLLFIDEGGVEMHAAAKTVDTPLARLSHGDLCPGSAALDALQRAYR